MFDPARLVAAAAAAAEADPEGPLPEPLAALGGYAEAVVRLAEATEAHDEALARLRDAVAAAGAGGGC